MTRDIDDGALPLVAGDDAAGVHAAVAGTSPSSATSGSRT